MLAGRSETNGGAVLFSSHAIRSVNIGGETEHFNVGNSGREKTSSDMLCTSGSRIYFALFDKQNNGDP